MREVLHKRNGFTLLELLIVISVIAIVAAIAIPNLVNSRVAAGEASTIGALRTLNSAESDYRSKNVRYGTLTELGAASLIDPALSGASSAAGVGRSGYFFDVGAATFSGYYATAVPALVNSDARQFYTDEAGVIYAAPNTATTPTADTGGAAPPGFGQLNG